MGKGVRGGDTKMRLMLELVPEVHIPESWCRVTFDEDGRTVFGHWLNLEYILGTGSLKRQANLL